MWAASPAAFRFGGSTPHRAAHLGVFTARHLAGNAGLYYLTAPKRGKVHSRSSKAPHTGFGVSPDWVFSLVSGHKMDIQDGRTELIACGKGLVRRLADLDRLEHARREVRLSVRIEEIQRAQEASALDFRRMPQVEDWLAEASRPMQRRKRFLVLEGPSGVGKTEFTRSLRGPSRTLELNCAGCRFPDLRSFDPEVHQLILFDEGLPEMVSAHRKLFQCPPVQVDLGHSPTGQSVYKVFLNDSVLVICSNGWREAVAALPNPADRDWIRANQVLVVVESKLFIPKLLAAPWYA